MLFNVFTKNTNLSCSVLFFLIIDLNSLIPAVVAQISNPISELAVPIEIPSEEVKVEIEMRPVIPEAKIRKWSIKFRM